MAFLQLFTNLENLLRREPQFIRHATGKQQRKLQLKQLNPHIDRIFVQFANRTRLTNVQYEYVENIFKLRNLIRYMSIYRCVIITIGRLQPGTWVPETDAYFDN